MRFARPGIFTPGEKLGAISSRRGLERCERLDTNFPESRSRIRRYWDKVANSAAPDAPPRGPAAHYRAMPGGANRFRRKLLVQGPDEAAKYDQLASEKRALDLTKVGTECQGHRTHGGRNGCEQVESRSRFPVCPTGVTSEARCRLPAP